MTTPSFERFDYQLRSNKHVERKLVFDFLIRARRRFDTSNYNYLGLGSMWFADHRLAHRLLDVDKLISIEASNAARADFNKPFGTVEVLPGMSHDVLPTWTDEQWSNPFFAWMDYDGLLDQNIAADLSTFSRKLKPNSVLLVTANANYLNYKVKQSAVERAQKAGTPIDPRAIATLIKLLGDVVPAEYQGLKTSTGKPADVSAENFPKCMAESLIAFLRHKITVSGREHGGKPLRFVPLFNFCHKDGVEMVTVGGAIADAVSDTEWENILVADPVLKNNGKLPAHHRLDLIPITLREKLVLDSLLPSGAEQFAAGAIALGLKIAEDQAEKYRLHYKHFPTFVESPI